MTFISAAKDTPTEYCWRHRVRFLAELKEFIRFPSISAQPRHAPDTAQCAAWLADHLSEMGLEQVRVIPTPRHPLVYADWRHAPDRLTLLIYGHYDVQPPEPLEAWRTPPFEPVVRDGNLYGRGASDDKGQLFAHLKAIEAYLRTAGSLPVNVKVILEGEEEIGSGSLMAFVRQHGGLLAADAAVVSDMRIPAPDRPALTTALRGMLSLELVVHGPRRDLHSGTFGGAVHNPLQALCEILAGLYDGDGRIAIPGFYDHVRPQAHQERAYMAQVGPTDAEVLHDAGAGMGWGERGYSLYERTTIRPALTINGISGGYAGPGPKAVIPAQASAKLSFRLVPEQDPQEVDRLFRAHITAVAPPGVRCRVLTVAAARPVSIERRGWPMCAAEVAYTRGFGRAPVYLGSGGTIPVVNTLQEALGIPTVLMGFALPDDSMHGPDEKFHLPSFFKAINTSIHFLMELSYAQHVSADRH